jgi:hypothetical protein
MRLTEEQVSGYMVGRGGFSALDLCEDWLEQSRTTEELRAERDNLLDALTNLKTTARKHRKQKSSVHSACQEIEDKVRSALDGKRISRKCSGCGNLDPESTDLMTGEVSPLCGALDMRVDPDFFCAFWNSRRRAIKEPESELLHKTQQLRCEHCGMRVDNAQ